MRMQDVPRVESLSKAPKHIASTWSRGKWPRPMLGARVGEQNEFRIFGSSGTAVGRVTRFFCKMIGKARIPHKFSIELSKPRLISTKLLLQKQTVQRVHKKAKKASIKRKELRELKHVDCGENL